MNDGPAGFGDTVRVHFRAMMADGFIVESTIGREPIEFMIGKSRFPIGLVEAVEGMVIGQTLTLEVGPERGHGRWKENLVKEVELPLQEAAKVQQGCVTMVNTGDGMKVPAMVTRKEGCLVWLDFNHPLADKTLTYEITLVEIVKRAIQGASE